VLPGHGGMPGFWEYRPCGSLNREAATCHARFARVRGCLPEILERGLVLPKARVSKGACQQQTPEGQVGSWCFHDLSFPEPVRCQSLH